MCNKCDYQKDKIRYHKKKLNYHQNRLDSISHRKSHYKCRACGKTSKFFEGIREHVWKCLIVFEED